MDTFEKIHEEVMQPGEFLVPVDAAPEKVAESRYFVWYPKPPATITIIWHGRYEMDNAKEMEVARERQKTNRELRDAIRFEQTISPHPQGLTKGEYYLYVAIEAGAVVGCFYQLGPVCWNLGRPNLKRYGGWQAHEGVLAQLLARVLKEELHGPGIVTPDAVPKIVTKLSKAPITLDIDFNLPPWSSSHMWIAPAGTVHYKRVKG